MNQTYRDVVSSLGLNASANVLPHKVNSQSPVDVMAHSLSFSLLINVYLLVKLDEHNYMIWRDQLLIYATTYGLEGVIDGSLAF